MAYIGQQKREYQRMWVRDRRNEYLAKFGSKCRLCDSTDKLEFDHIDSRTKIDHKIWSWARHRIETELDKCQLLCAACHIEKTYTIEYADIPKMCGTLQAYKRTRNSCRCNLCSAANADYERIRRNKL